MASMCYEWTEGEGDTPAAYEFAGEYIGAPACIPAWTMEEISVMLGSEFNKPDMMGKEEYQLRVGKKDNEHERNVRMMQFIIYFPEVKKEYQNGARAYADFLIYALKNNHVKAKECNDRLNYFYTKKFI